MSGFPLDKEEVSRAAERALVRFTGLLRSVKQPDAVACGVWTTGDVAAHVSGVFDWMLTMADGEPSPIDDHHEISAASDRVLSDDPERDPSVLADRIETRGEEFFTRMRGRVGDPDITWHGGIKIPLSVLASLVLSEGLIHGLDIARAEKVPWEISTRDAVLINAGNTHLIPYFVNENAASGLTTTYRIRLRGADSFLLAFTDGSLSVEQDSAGRRVDCTVSAEPVTWQLVGYGRANPFSAAATGKMVVYGRKPWLGLKLPKLFGPP